MKQQSKFKESEIGKIAEDWDVKKVEDFCEKITSGGTPSRRIPNYWKNGTIPWLKTQELLDNDIYNTEEKITELGLKNSSAKHFPPNTVIMAMYGATVGKLAILKVESTTNQACCAMIPNEKISNHKFLFYALLNFREKIISFACGAAQQNLNQDIIKTFKLPFPQKAEQDKIASVLSSLDDKIALNRSMNSTLESIGQALFKHWFVDFEFPDGEGKPYRSSGGEMVKTELGEVPKGWEVAKLNEIAEFIRGFSYAGSEKSKVSGDNVFVTLNSIYEGGGFKREFSYLTSDRVKERHLVKEGDIIIANTEQTKTGTLLGFPALVEFPLNYNKIVGVFSHHITKVIPFREEVKHFLYHYLYFYQTNAIKYHTGSVIWALDVNGWTNNEKIILPKKEILITFSKLMNSIFQKKLKNNIESNTLENIRDALLPKLMSGEIRVKVSESEAAK